MTCKAPLIGQIKARRQTLGWSVKDVADRCGIGEKMLSEWERGAGHPPLDALLKWISTLGLERELADGPRDDRPGVRIDWDERRITVAGAPVRLTPMEWKALERLARVPGEVVSHQALFRHLYGEDEPYRAQSTAIRVLITKLRRLLPLRIEAQWGRGYVISGIESTLPRPPIDQSSRQGSSRDGRSFESGERRKPAGPAGPAGRDRGPGTRGRDSLALVPTPIPSDAPPLRRERVETGRPHIRRVAPPPGRPGACRAEELVVIEQFLAERGATRCPDVATIQCSPLPTLTWDKIKRKWVRPPLTGREATGREAS